MAVYRDWGDPSGGGVKGLGWDRCLEKTIQSYETLNDLRLTLVKAPEPLLGRLGQAEFVDGASFTNGSAHALRRMQHQVNRVIPERIEGGPGYDDDQTKMKNRPTLYPTSNTLRVGR